MENARTVGFMGGKFLPFHQGHIYALLAASNKVDELYVVLTSSENRDREICKRDGIKYIPPHVRLSWLGESFHDLENVKIIHIEDNHWDQDYDWEEGAKKIKEAIGKPINFVFSSESSYNDIFKKNYPESKHIIIDEGRDTVNISATELRRNLYGNWDKLPGSVKGYFTKKVAIVGTESCGKSTLTKKLAKFYNTNLVSEVGREYCEKYLNLIDDKVFNEIAMDHFLRQTKEASQSNKLLFIDSDAVVTQYYFDMYYKQHSSLIEEITKLQNYDLMLYLEPDIKWVDDGIRFAGQEEERIRNNQKLKQMYSDRGINFVSIDGSYEERFNKSRSLIDKLFVKGASNEI